MNKLFKIIIVLTITSSTSFGAGMFDGFAEELRAGTGDAVQKTLDAFTQDVGGVMNGGSFHRATVLGFPGLDIGIHVPVMPVLKDDTIIRSSNINVVALPILQAEVGLPGRTDLIVRYTSYDTSSLMGFGLRFGLVHGTLPGAPSLAIQSVYSMLSVNTDDNMFTASSLGVLLSASFNLVLIDPYIGIGYDTTTVTPDASLGLSDPALKGNASGVRVEGGVNIALLPSTYFRVGVALTGGEMGGTASLGMKF